MKIKVTDLVLNYENKPIESNDKGKFIDWRLIIYESLNSFRQEELPLTAEIQSKVYQITSKAYANDEPDFTISEIAFILERIKKIETPLVIGRAEEFFAEKKNPQETTNPETN